MDKRCAIDWAIVLVCLVLFLITCIYPHQIRHHILLMCLSGIMALVFLIIAAKDGKLVQRNSLQENATMHTEAKVVTELILLSEEDTKLCVWDIYGKTALVIGRDVKENQVDIDLNASPYASMVDIEHAVLNFSSGSWYVEDLGSKNGIRIKKAADGRIYQLSADTPCKIEKGDILYIGLNRLLFC